MSSFGGPHNRSTNKRTQAHENTVEQLEGLGAVIHVSLKDKESGETEEADFSKGKLSNGHKWQSLLRQTSGDNYESY
jgi:hypothetical protein